MKYFVLTFFAINMFSLQLFKLNAQSSKAKGINYQAYAIAKTSYDIPGVKSVNRVITNKEIKVRISLLKGSVDGQKTYVEEHDVKTNDYGLFNLKIGQGKKIEGTAASVADIQWESSAFFVKVELKIDKDGQYQLSHTDPINYYPYAFMAETAKSVIDGAIKTSNIADGAVTSEKIADGAVTTKKIADGAVTTKKIADGSIDSAKIKHGAIRDVHIATGAVTNSKIKPNAITSKKIMYGAIQSRHIADKQITSRHIDDGAVKSLNIGNKEVTTKHIADGAIGQAQIEDGSIGGDNIKDDAIKGRHIADNTITSDNIKDGSIKYQDIADNSIDSAKIKNGAIKSIHIANKAVTTDKIKNGTIQSVDIADNAVTTGKIKDGAVTEDKIANNAVTKDKIKNAAVTTLKIADEAVTTLKIADGAVTTGKIKDGAVTSAKIKDGAVTNSKIKAGQVTKEKFSLAGVKDGQTFRTKIETKAGGVKDTVWSLASMLGANYKGVIQPKHYKPNGASNWPPAGITFESGDYYMINTAKSKDTIKVATGGPISGADTVKIGDWIIYKKYQDALGVTQQEWQILRMSSVQVVLKALHEIQNVDTPKPGDGGKTIKYNLAKNRWEIKKDEGITTLKHDHIFIGDKNDKPSQVRVWGDIYYKGLDPLNSSYGIFKIANDSVTTAKIANKAVTTAKIADGAVTKDKIANNAVTTAKIADNAVTTDKIKNKAVTTAKIADKAVTTAKIADNAVTSAKIKNKAVTTAKIADNAVTTAKIANGAVTSSKIGDTAVKTRHIADGAVTTAKIADNAVTTAKITDGSIVPSKFSGTGVIDGQIIVYDFPNSTWKYGSISGINFLRAWSVKEGLPDKDKYKAGTYLIAKDNGKVKIDGKDVEFFPGDWIMRVNTKVVPFWQRIPMSTKTATISTLMEVGDVDIKQLSNSDQGKTIKYDKNANSGAGGWILADDEVLSKLATNQIYIGDATGTAKGYTIKGDAKIEVKDFGGKDYGTITINNGAVTSAKIKDAAVTSAKIKDAAVTSAKIKDGAVDSSKIAKDAVRSIHIKDGAITSAKIKNDAVTSIKIASGAVTNDKIQDKAITNSKLSVASVSSGQTFKYDGKNKKWVYSSISGLSFIKGWDATTPVPNPSSVSSGSYLIVSKTANAAGDNIDLNGDGKTFLVKKSDWLIRTTDDSKPWEVISVSDTPIKLDKLSKIGNVDSPAAGNTDNGKVIKYNATLDKWELKEDESIENLTDGKIFVGNASNKAVEVTPSGDISISNTGVVTIKNNAVTTAKIKNGAVDSSKILAKAIKTVHLDDNAVTTAKIKDGAVTTAKIATGAVTSLKIGDTAVKTRHIYTGAVTTDKIANGAVTNSKIGDTAVKTRHIYPGAVTNLKLDITGALDGQIIKFSGSDKKWKYGNITGLNFITAIRIDKYADIPNPSGVNTGTYYLIKNDGKVTFPSTPPVDKSFNKGDWLIKTSSGWDILNISKKKGVISHLYKISNVDTPKGVQDNGKILKYRSGQWKLEQDLTAPTLPEANIFIGNDKSIAVARPVSGDLSLNRQGVFTIGDDKVTTNKIAKDAVKTAKIADGAVTRSKIAKDAVDSSKIEDGTIQGKDIANNTITSSKIHDTTIEAKHIKAGVITGDKIQGNSIEPKHLKHPIQKVGGTILKYNGKNWAHSSISGIAFKGIFTPNTAAPGVNPPASPAINDYYIIEKEGYIRISGADVKFKAADWLIRSPDPSDPNSGIWQKVNIGDGLSAANVVKLTDIGDVENKTPVSGNVIKYDAADSEWKLVDAASILTDTDLQKDHMIIGTTSGKTTTSKITGDAKMEIKSSFIQFTIQKDSVNSDHIKDGAVTSAKIANDAVTTAKIANNAVTSAKIANDAVTTAKIANDAVTSAKIANDAVTTDKIKDGAIITKHISNGIIEGKHIKAPLVIGDPKADVSKAPYNESILSLVSSTKGFLPPRLTSAQRNAMSLTVQHEGMLLYDIDIKSLVFWDGQKWNGMGLSDKYPKVGTIKDWVGAVPGHHILFYNIEKYNYMPIAYTVVASKNGRLWLDRDLGGYGDVTSNPPLGEGAGKYVAYYYQAGRLADGHQYYKSNTVSGAEEISKDCSRVNKFVKDANGWAKEDGGANYLTAKDYFDLAIGENNPCPTGWKIPELSEWKDLFINTFSSGSFTGSSTSSSSSYGGLKEAFNAIKLHGSKSGYKDGADGNTKNATKAYYWYVDSSSKTMGMINVTSPESLSGASIDIRTVTNYGDAAFVRCIKK